MCQVTFVKQVLLRKCPLLSRDLFSTDYRAIRYHLMLQPMTTRRVLVWLNRYVRPKRLLKQLWYNSDVAH